MIRINLLEAPETKKSGKGTWKPSLSGSATGLAAAAIILICLAFIGWKYVSLNKQTELLNSEIAAADQELRELEKARRTVDEYQKKKRSLEQRVTLISDLKSQQRVPVHLLDQISHEIPEFLWLDKMVDKGKRIEISGRATTYNAVSNFYNNLKDSPYFEDVELGNTQRVAEGVSFHLTTSFEAPRRTEKKSRDRG